MQPVPGPFFETLPALLPGGAARIEPALLLSFLLPPLLIAWRLVSVALVQLALQLSCVLLRHPRSAFFAFVPVPLLLQPSCVPVPLLLQSSCVPVFLPLQPSCVLIPLPLQPCCVLIPLPLSAFSAFVLPPHPLPSDQPFCVAPIQLPLVPSCVLLLPLPPSLPSSAAQMLLHPLLLS